MSLFFGLPATELGDSAPTEPEPTKAEPPGAKRLPRKPPPLAAIFVGMVGGFATISIVNTITTPVFTHAASAFAAAGRDAWDLALTSSVGAVSGGILAAVAWAHRKSHFRHSAVLPIVLHAGIAVLVVRAVMGEAVAHQAAAARDGAFALLFEMLMLLGAGLGIALAHWIGSLAGRRIWASVPWALVAVAGAALNASLYRDDFFESHCVGGWAAAAGIAGTLTTLASRWIDARPMRQRRAVIVCALPLLTALLPPSNRIRLEVFESPAAIGAWAHAALIWHLPTLPKNAPLPPGIDPAWLEAPFERAAVKPSEDRLVDGAPIVILITIDAVRADVLLDPANDSLWPNLARLKRTGALFTDARAAGSQTAVSLSALFSGRYFSELYWSKHGTGGSRFDYPAEDPAARFPSLLDENGVSTVKFGAIRFLANDFGVAPGFTEDVMLVDDRRHAFASEVIDPLLVRLRNAGPGPLFLYAHLMEPHAPYDRGTKVTGPPFERYKSEIGAADLALGRVLRATSTPALQNRVLLIVSADHGEAFGEHGTFEHTKTLYDELLRVPLLVAGRHVVPQRVAQSVGLIDIGPTILDVFGVETPGSYMGQSLVPLLDGRDEELTRPVFAEGRLKRSLVVGNVKVISDSRRKVVEGFDLKTDPGETRNLYDEEPSRVVPLLAAMQRFFDARACSVPGYTPVYKP